MFFSGAAGPTFYAPASGTVTAVRVKGGSAGGPVQVLVMRSLYRNKAGDPGHPYLIKVGLNKAGKKKLGRRSWLTLTATATIGSKSYSSRIKFTRPRRR